MRSHTQKTAGIRRKAVWAAGARVAGAIVLAAAAAGCGDMQREGQASSFLIVNALEAASGADPSTFAGTLRSDVVTVVDGSSTIYNDIGRVNLVLAMKDPGTTSAPSAPTSANFITINRYHVRYIRADGRNTPGVDVPYGFDGGLTVTVGDGEAQAGFTIVRNLAKAEAPLAALGSNGVIISMIAEVTFFGHDQTGREVSAVGNISIDFGNFADKTT